MSVDEPTTHSQLVNQPTHAEAEAVDGLVWAHAQHMQRLVYADAPTDAAHAATTQTGVDQQQSGGELIGVVRRGVFASGQVALVSGGGSGHEPAHCGLVGAGMLSGAVAGAVFTSPSARAVEAMLVQLQRQGASGGVLLVLKNYTGDRLNFGLATEMAAARCGVRVRIVVVADDCALEASPSASGERTAAWTPGNRRGLAGTVLVHKCAGAEAAKPTATLASVEGVAREVIRRVRTMNVSLGGCTIPAVGAPGFVLPPGEMELGLGIHGEAGVRRAPLLRADALTTHLLECVCTDVGLQAGARVALLLNNLGGVTQLEMGVLTRALLRSATRVRGGLRVERLLVGVYMTSLDMRGFSVSVLEVDDTLLALLDAPTSAPGWIPASTPAASLADTRVRSELCADEQQQRNETETGHRGGEALEAPRTENGRRMQRVLLSVAGMLKVREAHFTALDQAAGDGDLGLSLTRGADCVLRAPNTLPYDQPGEALRLLGARLARALAGSSGPLYGVFCLRVAALLCEEAGRQAETHTVVERAEKQEQEQEQEQSKQEEPQEKDSDERELEDEREKGMVPDQKESAEVEESGASDERTSMRAWACALLGGAQAISELGGATPGDCTMLDALCPAVKAFAHAVAEQRALPEAVACAAEAAFSGAERTVGMRVAKGRGAYLGERAVGCMDPGAGAVACIAQTIAEALSNESAAKQ
jgi:dihydroxyacetone kinase